MWFLVAASSCIIYPYHHLFSHHFWRFLWSLAFFSLLHVTSYWQFALDTALATFPESVRLKAEKGLTLRLTLDCLPGQCSFWFPYLSAARTQSRPENQAPLSLANGFSPGGPGGEKFSSCRLSFLKFDAWTVLWNSTREPTLLIVSSPLHRLSRDTGCHARENVACERMPHGYKMAFEAVKCSLETTLNVVL